MKVGWMCTRECVVIVVGRSSNTAQVVACGDRVSCRLVGVFVDYAGGMYQPGQAPEPLSRCLQNCR